MSTPNQGPRVLSDDERALTILHPEPPRYDRRREDIAAAAARAAARVAAHDVPPGDHGFTKFMVGSRDELAARWQHPSFTGVEAAAALAIAQVNEAGYLVSAGATGQ